ncbi:hypothetical protein O3P69_003757 [Scylla paramamosain]|uniref:Uncharacterized protein n=1 Tax=Scylla paramamosain TaxID=85552 RepID=A0AAW0UGI7_SCYPA
MEQRSTATRVPLKAAQVASSPICRLATCATSYLSNTRWSTHLPRRLLDSLVLLGSSLANLTLLCNDKH